MFSLKKVLVIFKFIFSILNLTGGEDQGNQAIDISDTNKLQLNGKLNEISEQNPIELPQLGIRIIGINDINFHDNKSKANFTMHVVYDNGDYLDFRASKNKWYPTLTLMMYGKGFWIGELNDTMEISSDFSDYLDRVIWKY